ncbi:gamma-glutamyl-gamma-aminobutyrate hydrolase family protein, partial [Escherichia coli]|uniref:gamma-glutamyl-gamma-aminobutyrate hydrolase family protein n=1 Tax=Escherichia coli TaxID=562 RepID=UPI002FBDFA40
MIIADCRNKKGGDDLRPFLIASCRMPRERRIRHLIKYIHLSMAVINSAHERRLPNLAICRGLQELVVA